MRLYTYFRSSAAYRVRIALNLKGLAYEPVFVNLLKGEQKGDGFRAVNPQGRLPALDTGEAVLIQSPAILEWLEEVHPEPPLLPREPLARARVRAAAAIIACDVHPPVNSGPLAYLKGAMGQDQGAVDAWYAHWVREGFAALERLVAPAPFAFGERPGLADLHIVPQVFNARRFRVPLDDFPKIRAVEAACLALDAFRAAAPEAQPDAA